MNRVLVTLTLMLAAAAAMILIVGSQSPNDARGEEFQRLVGGYCPSDEGAQDFVP